MSHDIRFRAWDDKRGVMFDVNNGYLPKGVTRKRDFFIGFNSTGLEVSEYEGKGCWRIFPIMQWTGIQDVNGTLIYKGDIVEYDVSLDGRIRDTKDVKYIPHKAAYGISEYGLLSNIRVRRVVGNIFEGVTV